MNENKAIETVEQIFNGEYLFTKSYPDWLKNIHGTQLELDGYNESLHIAIEYNGPYHYDAKYYKTKEQFITKQQSDAIKIKLCKSHGVLLIIIPYKVSMPQMYDYILSRLYDANYYRIHELPLDYMYIDVVSVPSL